MDTEYHLDYDAILKTVRKGDVIAFRFVTVPMRLLIDNIAVLRKEGELFVQEEVFEMGDCSAEF